MQEKIFADANSNYEKARYVICGVPFDGTSCFRSGSRLAPDEIRAASYNFETYSRYFDFDLEDANIHDAGNLEVGDNIDDTLSSISEHAVRFINDDKIPIMLGGEHSLSYPFVRACKDKYPEIGFVVLDAHMDLREEYDNKKNSHACISRRVIEDLTGRYLSIGVRSGTRQEYEYARQNNIRMFTSEDIFEKGIEEIISEFKNYIKGPVYLSIDMDAVDPAYAPALGTPEPYGITPRDVRAVISALAPDVVGFDLMEIAPSFDSGGTAILGAKFVRDFIASNAKSGGKP